MTDEPDIEQTDDETASEAPQGPVAGERLAAARREQQITLDEVAKELHLDEPKVRALERNEFDVLGAPVFAKGHLRKYAQLVGISMDEVVAEFESLNRTSDEPPLVVERRRPPRELAAGPWVALVMALAIAGFVYWWFVLRVPPAPAPAMDTAVIAVPAGDTTADTTAAGTEPADAAVVDAAPGDAPDAASQAPVAAQTAPLPQPSAADQTTLTLTFVADCWTEITDADGTRLFFALGREGRSVDLVGRAPFAVVFGDADAVDVEIDGVPFEIPAAARTGRMARLSIVAR